MPRRWVCYFAVGFLVIAAILSGCRAGGAEDAAATSTGETSPGTSEDTGSPAPVVATGPPVKLVTGRAVEYFRLNPEPSSTPICGDFNEDGRSDLAWASEWDATLCLLLGGEEGLAAGVGLTQPEDLDGTFLGGPADFNGDSHQDLLVFLFSDLQVALGNADGTFQPPLVCSLDLYPSAVATDDFNGDGRVDVATCGSCEGEDRLAILVNAGEGAFEDPVLYPVGEYPEAMAAADLDGDGDTDLAVACAQTSNPEPVGPDMVMFFVNNGKGVFEAGASLTGIVKPWFLVATDLNGDGRADLVVTEPGDDGGGSLAVFLGQRKGVFAAPVRYPAAYYPGGLAARDLNGNGRPDLVVLDESANPPLLVLQDAGDGTLQTAVAYPAPGEMGLRKLSVGDFDGDGKPDVVVIGAPPYGSNDQSTIQILLNQTDYAPN